MNDLSLAAAVGVYGPRQMLRSANEPASLPYDHRRCVAAYMSRAAGYYRFRHVSSAASA